MKSTMRRLVAAAALLAAGVSAGRADAQTVNRDDILYILPYWGGVGASDPNEITNLRNRLGPEGPYVKLGFSVYIFISMDSWTVDPSDPAAIRLALAGTISQIDGYLAKAIAGGFPLALMLQTAVRDRTDPAQTASQAEDVRSMMWYADNVLAANWWTHTRYARKQQAIQEAYIRELGKIVANRMSLYPDTLVAASGDGEQELAFARNATIYADYTPFAVAEFRDWVRLGGLYATGAAFAGQGYSLGSRYAGDDSPAVDTNGDGHTLNTDFGTAFQSWSLLHFDWSLNDTYQTADPRAIPLATYSAPGFERFPGEIPGGFDPPRVPKALDAGDRWWNLWVLFKQTMLQRHNIEFAKWMTTSPDPVTSFTIPRERWYSNQVPADYLFNGTPENPNDRWYSSMSSWWTADVSPYGSLGITAFNVDFQDASPEPFIAYTLRNVAPHIAARDLRWGIIEWHPGQLPEPPGGFSTKLELYRSEMAVIEQYRPSLLTPFYWGATGPNQVQDTGFETALREMIARNKDGRLPDPRMRIDGLAAGQAVNQPFTVAGWAVDLGKILGPGRDTGVDLVHLYAYPNWGSGTPPISLGAASYGSTRPDIGQLYGTQFTNSGFVASVNGLPSGSYRLVAFARSTVTGTFNNTSTVDVRVDLPQLGLDRTELRFGGVNSNGTLTSQTSAQTVTVTPSGAGTVAWTVTPNQPWIQVSPTAGTGAGTFSVSVVNSGSLPASGSLTGSILVSSADAANAPTVPVTFTLSAPSATTRPIGSLDVPSGAITLSGSILVGGWTLDDIGINRVEIYRDRLPGEPDQSITRPEGHPAADRIYIATAELVRTLPFGNDTALFIDGARPDIEAMFPAYPWNYRAGWGYLMLTWGLPNQGTGTYTLSAYAFDQDGTYPTDYTLLGSKTFTSDNTAAGAPKPFGAIDAPFPGETVSGVKLTGGWALTQPFGCGVTNVWVSIDDRPLEPVIYGDPIAGFETLFPPTQFANSPNVGAAYFLDTTTLANGIHQIGYLVLDSCGHLDGIGSRFFTVFNAPVP